MKYIPPEDDSMDGQNFHSLFRIEKNGSRYVARFNQNVPFKNMGSTAQMLYYRSRDVVQHFLNYKVLPRCEPELLGKISRQWIDICLHDMVGQDEVDYTVLGFSALDTDTDNILVPDLYAMQNYFGALDEPDPFLWNHKLDEFFFIGNYTGDGRPLVNKRASFCRWSLDKSWCHSFLSENHQVSQQTFFEADPGYERYTHTPLPKKYQKMYRHLVSIDGNTAAWDRPVWIMASNSVLWKQESNHVCWWSHMCQEGRHYIGFQNPEDIESKWKSNINFQQVISNANQFVNENLREDGHVKKWIDVLSMIEKGM
jgi:hypothetical protein